MPLAVLRASLPIRLRHNFQTQWLNAFLFADRSHSVMGDVATLEALASLKSPPTIGVTVVDQKSLRHHFVIAENENAARIRWFDHWIRERRSWWKRHCYDSTMFKAHAEERLCTIVYDGNLQLETVTAQSRMITCTVSLDDAVKCLLDDSTLDEATHKCIHLHHELAPFQTSVGTSTSTMKSHAENLIEMLKKFDISVVPICSDVQEGDEQRHFADCDALGVCFNVLFTESTLQHGYVEIRNRDTAVSEKVDANNCAITLATYLKSMRPVLEKSLASDRK